MQSGAAQVRWGGGGACMCGNVINPSASFLQVCGILPQTADSGLNPTKREEECTIGCNMTERCGEVSALSGRRTPNI